MSKFGFVYIWFDRKNKKFYIGRHWGTEDDGYICSSNTMREAYRRRPKDFKRRIVSHVNDKEVLISEEQRWLDMIKPNEIGTRYYNKTLKATTPSTRGYSHTEETKRRISESNKGKSRSKDFKDRLRQASKKQFEDPQQIEMRKKKSLELWQDENYVNRVKKAMKNGVTDEVRRIRSENMKRINKLRWNKSTE